MGMSISAMWNNKCPRCREGDLFVKPFKVGDPLAMPKYCKVCDKDFEPEPGYYFGAMFLSYAISTFLLLPTALLLVFYYNWSVEGAMVMVIFLGAVLFLKILRVSRSLWIHIMVRYNPSYKKT